ncbi:hypothetical protein H4R27_000002 [Coemansia aciculifera]|nr:hypothetical protein H4R27_000002 [Coemansia aciculifera]
MPSFINKALRGAKKASQAVGFVLGLKETFPTPAVPVTVSVRRTSSYSTTAATKYEYVYKYEEDDDVVDNKWLVTTAAQSLMAAATIIEAHEKAIERAMDDIREGEVAVCRGMAHIKDQVEARKAHGRDVEIREKVVETHEKGAKFAMASIEAYKMAVMTREEAVEIREKAVEIREKASKFTETSVNIRERVVETHTKAAKRAMTSVEAHKKVVNCRMDSIETREKALRAQKEAVEACKKPVEAREKPVEHTISCVKKHKEVVYRVIACFGECEESVERTFGRIEPASSTVIQSGESADINSVTPVPDVLQASDVSLNKPEDILGSRDTSAPIENMTERSKQACQARARLEMVLEAL